MYLAASASPRIRSLAPPARSLEHAHCSCGVLCQRCGASCVIARACAAFFTAGVGSTYSFTREGAIYSITGVGTIVGHCWCWFSVLCHKRGATSASWMALVTSAICEPLLYNRGRGQPAHNRADWSNSTLVGAKFAEARCEGVSCLKPRTLESIPVRLSDSPCSHWLLKTDLPLQVSAHRVWVSRQMCHARQEASPCQVSKKKQCLKQGPHRTKVSQPTSSRLKLAQGSSSPGPVPRLLRRPVANCPLGWI